MKRPVFIVLVDGIFYDVFTSRRAADSFALSFALERPTRRIEVRCVIPR